LSAVRRMSVSVVGDRTERSDRGTSQAHKRIIRLLCSECHDHGIANAAVARRGGESAVVDTSALNQYFFGAIDLAQRTATRGTPKCHAESSIASIGAFSVIYSPTAALPMSSWRSGHAFLLRPVCGGYVPSNKRAPCANETCATFPVEISGQQGSHDIRSTAQSHGA